KLQVQLSEFGSSRDSCFRNGGVQANGRSGARPCKTVLLSEGQEVLQELLARLGQDRLGMELHTFQLVPAGAHPPDQAVIRLPGDRQLTRQRLALYDQ